MAQEKSEALILGVMSLETLVATAIGAVISVLTLWYSLRHSVGARQEKVNKIHENIVEKIVKHFVSERIMLDIQQIEYLRRGYSARIGHELKWLRDAETILMMSMTSIFENDYIQKDTKIEAFDFIRKILNEQENTKTKSISKSDEILSIAPDVMIGVATAILAGAVGSEVFLRAFSDTVFNQPSILVTIVAILLPVAMFAMTAYVKSQLRKVDFNDSDLAVNYTINAHHLNVVSDSKSNEEKRAVPQNTHSAENR